jgi:CBS domain-containing protein
MPINEGGGDSVSNTGLLPFTAAKEANMLVKEIMTPKMEMISASLTLQEAARRMRDLNIGSLPVAENGKLVGFVTDRDICCRGMADALAPNASVREVMSRDIAFCFSDDNVNQAAQQMERRHIRRLAVLNRDKSVAGFLSVDDLAHYSWQLAGEVLDHARAAH